MSRISGPRRVVLDDHEAYLWDVEVDGVPHDFAWWVSDGTIRWSYPTDGVRPSQFVRLGPRYSPQHSLLDAHAAVEMWVSVQEEDQQKAS